MADAPAHNGLDRSMLHAITWNALAKWSTQLSSWAATILVARLLAPSDYGLLGMAGIYMVLAGLISQVGIADAVVAIRDMTRRQIAELNTVAILVGIALIIVSCAAAYPLASFFSAPQLRAVIVATSVTYLFNGLMVIPRSLLQKELRFRFLAGVESARALSQTGATLLLAWLGCGFWSLVDGQIVGVALATALTLYWRRHEFAKPNFARLRRELQFSGNMMISSIAWYAYSNADFIVAGRMLGQAQLGDYTVAWTISSAPNEKIGNLITTVTPAFFSAVQHDKSQLRRYLLRLTEALSLVTLPASIGIALVADYLVPVLLGAKWSGVTGPLRLLGLLMAFRSIAILPGRVLAAIGDTQFVMWMSALRTIVLPAAFFVGSRWGTNGIAVAWILVFPPIMLPEFHRTFRRIEMRTWEFISSITPALRASAVMVIATLSIRARLPHSWSVRSDFLFLTMIGGLAYTGTLVLLDRVRIRQIWQAFHSKRRRQSRTGSQTPISSQMNLAHEGRTPVKRHRFYLRWG